MGHRDGTTSLTISGITDEFKTRLEKIAQTAGPAGSAISLSQLVLRWLVKQYNTQLHQPAKFSRADGRLRRRHYEGGKENGK